MEASGGAHARPLPSRDCGDLMASRQRDAFRKCHSERFPISIIRRSGPPRASTASSASSFPLSCCSWRSGCASGSGKQRYSWCSPGLFGRYIRANVGLLSGEALEAVLRDKASSVHHFWGLRLWVLLLQNKITIRPKQKKHTLTHFNEQELSCVHHARSAAAHGLPATPGAGFEKQRQPTA